MAYLPEGKSPGPDRLPNKFYRVFSKPLSIRIGHFSTNKTPKNHFPQNVDNIGVMALPKSFLSK
jgi:hypothetical protein